MLNELIEKSNLNRFADLERLESAGQLSGDFTGSVAGTWSRLDESGAAVVKHNDKEYYARRIGFTSIPAGQAVELSFGNGVYYANW